MIFWRESRFPVPGVLAYVLARKIDSLKEDELGMIEIELSSWGDRTPEVPTEQIVLTISDAHDLATLDELWVHIEATPGLPDTVRERLIFRHNDIYDQDPISIPLMRSYRSRTSLEDRSAYAKCDRIDQAA